MQPNSPENSPERQAILEEIASLQVKKLSVSPRDQQSIDVRVRELMDSLKELDRPKPAPASHPEEAEVERLQAKMAATSDPDLKEGLRLQIERLTGKPTPQPQSEIPSPSPEGATNGAPSQTAEDAMLPSEPTPQQVQEAENLLRQAKVAQMRNQPGEARRLIEQAAEVAPGSVPVLEALGDELVAAGKNSAAIKMYDRARKIDPSNVAVERKWANLVFSLKASASSPEMMLAGGGNEYINPKVAAFLSALLPGLGQLVRGEMSKGIWTMAVYIACVVILGLRFRDLAEIFARMNNPNVHPHYWVVIPLVIAVFVYLGSLFDASTQAKTMTRRVVEHPRPPVDLPFE